MFKKINDFWVPEKDVGCSAVVFSSLSDVNEAVKLCKKREVCIQAGGNFGVWPAYIAGIFDTVYTFEPDALNFACMCRNIGDITRIIKFQAALGDKAGCIDLFRRPENAGAHFICGAGNIPTMKIDSLALPACDLIVLDIEGYELKALKGAEITIQSFLPVIHLEDKGLSVKYGVDQGAAEKWLERIGYQVRDRVGRDVILSC